MENKLRLLGAISLAGVVRYELWEHDEYYVKLRDPQHLDRFFYIDKDALRSLASILNGAAKTLKVDEIGTPGVHPEPRL